MKLTLLMSCLLITIGINAQQQSPTENETQTLSVGVKTNSNDPQKQQSSERVRTIQNVDNEISDIKIKLEYVKNNPEEDRIAREEGWYEMIERKLEHLYKEKAELEEKRSNPGQKKTIRRKEFNDLPLSKQEIILSNPQIYTIED